MAIKMEIGRIYLQEKSRLLAFVRSRIGSLEEAEDILQDVFVRTLEGMSVTEPVDNLVAWLYTAARNRIIDHYRKKKPVSVPIEREEGLSLWEILEDKSFHPETLYHRKLLAEEITKGISALPEEQREVFILQELEGLAFREIAERTGESINTLISRKRYAVLALRKRLNAHKNLLHD